MSQTIALVACVSLKKTTPCAARDLYVSPWFQKARAYAEQFDKWFILSAAHGVITPETIIQPYDITLNTTNKTYRQKWQKRVQFQLRSHVTRGDYVIILAGERYRDGLAEHLQRRGIRTSVPMLGLGIGRQLAWLTRANEAPR